MTSLHVISGLPPPPPQSKILAMPMPGTSEIFTKSHVKYKSRQKKVSPSKSEAPGTVPYGKFAPGNCTTFIKRLHESLR